MVFVVFFFDFAGGQKILEDEEETEIENVLLDRNEELRNSEIQFVVQQFVKERRQLWIENSDVQALTKERRFRADDCPSLQWCSKFISRRIKLKSKIPNVPDNETNG